jgi:hypothetical protein
VGRGENALLCLTCNRVRPARNTAEYTVVRAQAITVHGLCTCAQPGAWPPYGVAAAARPRDGGG